MMDDKAKCWNVKNKMFFYLITLKTVTKKHDESLSFDYLICVYDWYIYIYDFFCNLLSNFDGNIQLLLLFQRVCEANMMWSHP